MADRNREVEIKLRLAAASQGRTLLRRAGFRISRRRVFEQNTLFDTARQELRHAHTGLRLRSAGGASILTFKGPPQPGRHKDREELETGVADVGKFRSILERLGYQPIFRYEKYRTEYRQPHSTGRAMLDETPIGVFLELEGPPRWIDRAARALGFTEADYVTKSYADLHLQARGGKLADMVFEKPD